MHRLELKIPPVVVVILAGFLIWLGASLFPAFNFRFPLQSMVALVIGLSGLFVSAMGVIEFKRAKTTVNPTTPGAASSLVRTGIYRQTRNPMYMGFLLVLSAWGILSANFLAFLVLTLFVIYMNRFQIKPEERALTAIFGDEFKAYCGETPRWI